MTDVSTVRADLIAEQEALDAVLAGLDDAAWAQMTPSPGWAVADQIAHLSYFDRAAATAVTDPDAFAVMRDALFASGAGDQFTLEPARSLTPELLLAHWRAGRQALADAAAGLADDTRVEWYGPSMGAKSFLTARLMECWAHGQDVVDAVGADRPATDRLRHIAQLGVITRGWSYRNRGMTPPEAEVAVRLDAPSGESWSWGPEAAADSIDGPAEDFCLVVTQRRNVADTALVVRGAAARDWLAQAQAFAGPASDGPAAGGR